jgi:hypothetical protein
MIPTAMSMTLPLAMKFLNSFNIVSPHFSLLTRLNVNAVDMKSSPRVVWVSDFDA